MINAIVPGEPDMDIINSCKNGKNIHKAYYYSWRDWDYVEDIQDADVLKIGFSDASEIYKGRYGSDLRRLKRVCIWTHKREIIQHIINNPKAMELDLDNLKKTTPYKNCLRKHFHVVELIQCEVSIDQKYGERTMKGKKKDLLTSSIMCMDHMFSLILKKSSNYISRMPKLMISENIMGQVYTMGLDFNEASLSDWLGSGYTEFFVIRDQHLKKKETTYLKNLFRGNGYNCINIDFDDSYLFV